MLGLYEKFAGPAFVVRVRFDQSLEKEIRMSAQISGVEGSLVTVVLSGKLSRSQLIQVQEEAAEVIRQFGKLCILVRAEQFAGWEKEGDWGDLTFQYENDPFIEKIAIVADEKWEGLALIFAGRGLRRPAIEFFPTSELKRARLWVSPEP